MSKRQLTEQEQFVLSLGLNFSLPPSHIEKETVFLGFESFFKQLCTLKPRSMAEETATKVNLASAAYNYCKLKSDINNIVDMSEIRQVVKNLKNDENIIISKPDKGNGCVILNKCDYLHKIQHIISDATNLRLLGPSKQVWQHGKSGKKNSENSKTAIS